jgi:hypothetical protein
MAAGSTYTPIATYTIPSATTSYTFSSIPSTYTDLVLVYTAATSSPADLYAQFNGDTGTNYSYTVLYGSNSSVAGSARTNNQGYISLDYYGIPDTTLGNSVTITNFMNYSNTSTYKTILGRSNRASNGLDALVNLWRSTSAINSIKIGSFTSTTISTGSTFTLYGIAAA